MSHPIFKWVTTCYNYEPVLKWDGPPSKWNGLAKITMYNIWQLQSANYEQTGPAQMHQKRVDTYGPTTNKHIKEKFVKLYVVQTFFGSEGDHLGTSGCIPVSVSKWLNSMVYMVASSYHPKSYGWECHYSHDISVGILSRRQSFSSTNYDKFSHHLTSHFLGVATLQPLMVMGDPQWSATRRATGGRSGHGAGEGDRPGTVEVSSIWETSKHISYIISWFGFMYISWIHLCV